MGTSRENYERMMTRTVRVCGKPSSRTEATRLRNENLALRKELDEARGHSRIVTNEQPATLAAERWLRAGIAIL